MIKNIFNFKDFFLSGKKEEKMLEISGIMVIKLFFFFKNLIGFERFMIGFFYSSIWWDIGFI